MRRPFPKVWKDKRGWLYVIRPHSGGYRGCYKKKGELDWRAVAALKAADKRKAGEDLEKYAKNHGMTRVI